MGFSHLMMLVAGYRRLPLAAKKPRDAEGDRSSILAPDRTVVKSTVPLLSSQGFREAATVVVRSL